MDLGEALEYVLKYLWVVSCPGFQIKYEMSSVFVFLPFLPPPLDKDEASLMAKEREAFKAGPSPCKLAELSTQGGTSSFVLWFLLGGGWCRNSDHFSLG